MSKERMVAVCLWISAEHREAYDLIYAEHPWLLNVPHNESMGYVREVA